MHGDYQLINIDSSMVSLNFQLKSRSPRVKSKSEISHRLAVGKCRDWMNIYQRWTFRAIYFESGWERWKESDDILQEA